LLTKADYFFLSAIEKVVSDVLLQILFTVFEKKVEVVGGLFDIEKLYNVRMLKVLQSLVLLLDSLDKIAKFVLQKFLDIQLLYDFDSIRLIIVFISVSFISAREAASPQAFVHLYHVAPHLLVLFLHFYLYIVPH